MLQLGKKIMKTRSTSSVSNAEQSNLANNDSRSERSKTMKQMTMFPQRVCSILVGAFFVGAFAFTVLATSPGALALTFTTIDVPGATRTAPFDINNRGQIVGDYVDAGGTSHGFLLDKGTFTTIDPPGSVFTQAIGINAAGRIVGDFELPGQHHGFLLDKGTFTLIDSPDPPTGTYSLG